MIFQLYVFLYLYAHPDQRWKGVEVEDFVVGSVIG